ncbi:MAG: malonyl-CoA decarboxylase domain-containing protein, partial [Alphaproteobacteria bacterium]
AGDIHLLLDESAPLLDAATADTAIFYSISNAQKGLAGIRFGDFLIKRVVAELAREFPNLKTFATLSPIPGFAAWLKDRIDAADAPALSEAEGKALAGLGVEPPDIAGLVAFARTPEGLASETCRAPLLRLCAKYLLREKRDGNRARDPVADFHLGNGARMERLNWAADLSPGAVAASAGMMINYLYKLGDIERNVEAYSAGGRVAASTALRSLAKG